MNNLFFRNEIFQRTDPAGIQKERERFTIQLRKKKRQAIINQHRSSSNFPLNAPAILESPKSAKNTSNPTLTTLRQAISHNNDLALSALSTLLTSKFSSETLPDSIPPSISQELINSLKFSNGSLKENTLKLIDKIFSENVERLFDFDQTDLFQTILKMLSACNIKTLPYILNLIFNFAYQNKASADDLTFILHHFNTILNNSSLSTLHIKISISSVYKQFKPELLPKPLQRQIVSHLISFIQTDSIELISTSITSLKFLLNKRDYLNADTVSAFPQFLTALESSLPKLVSDTLEILQLITAGENSHTQLLLNLGVLDTFVSVQLRFLYHGTGKIALLVATCISNILAGSEDQVLFTLNFKVPLITALFQCENDAIYSEAVFCTSNIVVRNSKQLTLKLIKNGTIMCMLSKLTVSIITNCKNCVRMIINIINRVHATVDGDDWNELVKDLQDKQIAEKLSAMLDARLIKDKSLIIALEEICMIIQEDELKSVSLEQPVTFKSKVELGKVCLQVRKIEDCVDRCAYSFVKNCCGCGTEVGKKGMKKFFCHFCYKAFCSACLPEVVMHPESRSLEKICQNCFIFYVKMQVVDAGTDYVVYCIQKENNLRQEAIEYTKTLETRLQSIGAEKLKLEAYHATRLKKKQEYLQYLVQQFEDAEDLLEKYAGDLNQIYTQIASHDISQESKDF